MYRVNQFIKQFSILYSFYLEEDFTGNASNIDQFCHESMNTEYLEASML